jgi:acetoin utilization deacetylase AcuC-like enzyme
VCSVAAALKATEMVVHGRYINGFCATRPPGHHAGRSLHPMKAISNGFCVLNAAACAAIYATTPVSENGLGLSRVCVIDFDVVSHANVADFRKPHDRTTTNTNSN